MNNIKPVPCICGDGMLLPVGGIVKQPELPGYAPVFYPLEIAAWICTHCGKEIKYEKK